MKNADDIVIVRGGGDIASGAIQKLYLLVLLTSGEEI